MPFIPELFKLVILYTLIHSLESSGKQLRHAIAYPLLVLIAEVFTNPSFGPSLFWALPRFIWAYVLFWALREFGDRLPQYYAILIPGMLVCFWTPL